VLGWTCSNVAGKELNLLDTANLFYQEWFEAKSLIARFQGVFICIPYARHIVAMNQNKLTFMRAQQFFFAIFVCCQFVCEAVCIHGSPTAVARSPGLDFLEEKDGNLPEFEFICCGYITQVSEHQ